MQVWNVLHAACWKYRTQKQQQSPKNHHLHTIAQLCPSISLQLTHESTIRKKLVRQQYLLHMSSQYGEFRPTNGWDLLASLRHPSKFQPVFAFWLRYCGDVTHRRPTKLCTMFGRLLAGTFVLWFVIAGRGPAYSGPQCGDSGKVHCACQAERRGIGWCVCAWHAGWGGLSRQLVRSSRHDLLSG